MTMTRTTITEMATAVRMAETRIARTAIPTTVTTVIEIQMMTEIAM